MGERKTNVHARLVQILLVFVLSTGLCDAIRCYGANAFAKAARGEKGCYRSLFGTWAGTCWASCGGITTFSQDVLEAQYIAPYQDPAKGMLCPWRQSGVNDGGFHFMGEAAPCNCSAWKEPLPGNKCPNCSDYDTIPPLMMSANRDAEYGGIELGECPEGSDICFNYCVTHEAWLPAISTVCAYGCAKSKNKPALELMVSVSSVAVQNLKQNTTVWQTLISSTHISNSNTWSCTYKHTTVYAIAAGVYRPSPGHRTQEQSG